MQVSSLLRLLKDPLTVSVYYVFEKWRTPDGRRYLSTNIYKTVAKFLNRIKFRRYCKPRDRFLSEFSQRVAFRTPDDFMRDGWHQTTTADVPEIAAAVACAKRIFEDKGEDINRSLMPYTVAHYDTLLNEPDIAAFAFSDKIIKYASDYLGEYPVLTNIGLVRTDPRPGQGWLEAQNLHLDVIDTKVFRVLVYVTDVKEENGPFSFYPLSISERLSRDPKLAYGGMLSNMGIEDHEIPSYASDGLIKITGQAATTFFVDTCRCFHFGSRAEVGTRGVLMLAYTGLAIENLRESMGLDIMSYDVPGSGDKERFLLDRRYIPNELKGTRT
jgi:hypothetical protein